MGYCFMTIEKIKTPADFTRKYEHNYRKEPVPNADELSLSNNEELVKLNGKTYLDAFHEKIEKSDYYNGENKRKVRADAVLGMEVITTFSREDRENIDIEQWKKDNVRWLEDTFNRRADKYGNNVISVVYHGDEAGNVHCHAIVIPMTENGSLSAKAESKNGKS